MQEAFELIGARDPSDTPTVALALTVPNDGIWASDKDFQAVEGALKVWSSRELLDELSMKNEDET
jgi:predicted nucleic acid-binding protein